MSLTQPGLFVLGLMLGSAVHELGHLVCGIVAGVPIRVCRTGIGPCILSRRIGDTWLELCLLPLSGIVLTYPVVCTEKFRFMSLYAGGFIGNALLFAVVAAMDSVRALTFLPTGAGMALALPQVLLVIVNLLPFRVRREGQWFGSDGLRLLELLFSPRRQQTALAPLYLAALHCYDTAAGQLALRSANAPRIFWWQFRPSRWAELADSNEEQTALRNLLAKGDLSPAEEMLLLDIAITDALAREETCPLAVLDVWSSKAIELGPDVIPLLASRGSVLTELGRLAEARKLLEPIANTNSGMDSFMSRLFLARVELSEGRSDLARKWTVAARAGIAVPSRIPPPFVAQLARLEAKLGVTIAL